MTSTPNKIIVLSPKIKSVKKKYKEKKDQDLKNARDNLKVKRYMGCRGTKLDFENIDSNYDSDENMFLSNKENLNQFTLPFKRSKWLVCCSRIFSSYIHTRVSDFLMRFAFGSCVFGSSGAVFPSYNIQNGDCRCFVHKEEIPLLQLKFGKLFGQEKYGVRYRANDYVYIWLRENTYNKDKENVTLVVSLVKPEGKIESNYEGITCLESFLYTKDWISISNFITNGSCLGCIREPPHGSQKYHVCQGF